MRFEFRLNAAMQETRRKTPEFSLICCQFGKVILVGGQEHRACGYVNPRLPSHFNHIF